MIKFISFGSGSSGNCYLLSSGNTSLMIDSGVGVRNLKKYLRDFGLRFENINAILVTHDHADHVKSVGVISNEYGIPVYATDAVHRGIEHNYCVRKKIEVNNKRVIEPGHTFSIGEFVVTPFDVPHDSCGNVGYRIENVHGEIFCLMTDIGHVTDDIRQNVSLADYLVVEANHDESMLRQGPYPQYLKERVKGDFGHLSNVSCAELLRDYASKRLKHVWLCHLSEENNHPELLRKTIEETLSSVPGVNTCGFEVDILKRKMPSEIFQLGK